VRQKYDIRKTRKSLTASLSAGLPLRYRPRSIISRVNLININIKTKKYCVVLKVPVTNVQQVLNKQNNEHVRLIPQ
jgi:hypothetical protein